jgi:hypothetical protein
MESGVNNMKVKNVDQRFDLGYSLVRKDYLRIVKIKNKEKIGLY